ncbi:cysteine hydrolase [Phaeacidiphilus oryzae]|jgi:nicotinamidase-related amidase|uniref:cysteine hydrolase n=1 Tax=Phaeacidiphilus oryzae TaxID=348818 RepID=UPI00056AF07C|nr:cysteine hydrolase [Phaeacidiphilus oryzae]
MPHSLADLVDPPTTVLLTQEVQRGVVGRDSALPELARAARESGALANIGRLVAAARPAGVQVLHAIAVRRADGRGANRNARLFRFAERSPVQQLVGSEAVRTAEEIPEDARDLVSTRLHGLSPIAGTDVDALLRNLGCRTLVVTGVSANIAIPNAVFDAVNLGYQVVVVRDAVAGVPPGYADQVIEHSLSLVATVATTEELLACWR